MEEEQRQAEQDETGEPSSTTVPNQNAVSKSADEAIASTQRMSFDTRMMKAAMVAAMSRPSPRARNAVRMRSFRTGGPPFCSMGSTTGRTGLLFHRPARAPGLPAADRQSPRIFARGCLGGPDPRESSGLGTGIKRPSASHPPREAGAWTCGPRSGPPGRSAPVLFTTQPRKRQIPTPDRYPAPRPPTPPSARHPSASIRAEAPSKAPEFHLVQKQSPIPHLSLIT